MALLPRVLFDGNSSAAVGGRIYDFHIAEIARASGAGVIVTDNRRHFLASLRYGVRIETPSEFLASMKTKRPGS